MNYKDTKPYMSAFLSVDLLTDFAAFCSTDFINWRYIHSVGGLNNALEYSTRVVQEGGRRCKKSTLTDLAYLTPLRIPLMNPV